MVSVLTTASESLYNRLLKVEKEALFNLMLEAMEDMKSSNGRTVSWCILNNIGEELEDGKWKVMTPDQINEKFGD